MIYYPKRSLLLSAALTNDSGSDSISPNLDCLAEILVQMLGMATPALPLLCHPVRVKSKAETEAKLNPTIG
jgi:hypothetical protein